MRSSAKPKSKKTPPTTALVTSVTSIRRDGAQVGGKNYVFLNTGGKCLLCFKDCDPSVPEETRNQNLQTSITFCRLTSRFLSFNLGKVVTESSKKVGRSCKSIYKTVELDKPRDKLVAVDLCERCIALAKAFCKIHFQAEFHQMTLERCVRDISEVIHEADKKSEKAHPTISEDRFISTRKKKEEVKILSSEACKSAQDLRKKLFQKSIEKLTSSFPHIRLRRINKSGDWISILRECEKNDNDDDSKKQCLISDDSKAVVSSLVRCLVSFWIVLSLSFIDPHELSSKKAKGENSAEPQEYIIEIIKVPKEPIPVKVSKKSTTTKTTTKTTVKDKDKGKKNEVKEQEACRPSQRKRKKIILADDTDNKKKNGIKRTKTKDLKITSSSTSIEPVPPKDVQVEKEKEAKDSDENFFSAVAELSNQISKSNSKLETPSMNVPPSPMPSKEEKPITPALLQPLTMQSENSTEKIVGNSYSSEVKPSNYYANPQDQSYSQPYQSNPPFVAPYPYYDQQSAPAPTSSSFLSSAHQYGVDSGYYCNNAPHPPPNYISTSSTPGQSSFGTFNYDTTLSQSEHSSHFGQNSSTWPTYEASSAIPANPHNSFSHVEPSTSYAGNNSYNNYDSYYGRNDNYQYPIYENGQPPPSSSQPHNYYYPNSAPAAQSQPHENTRAPFSNNFVQPPPPPFSDVQYTTSAETPSPPLTYEEPKYSETGEGPEEQLQNKDDNVIDENESGSTKPSTEKQALSVFPEVHWRQQQQNVEKIHCSVTGCTEQFIRKDHLELHLKAHGTFQCHFCHLSFSKAHSLALHEKSRHSTKSSSSSGTCIKNKCPRCDFSSSSQNNFFIHFLSEHLNIQIYGKSCEICKKKFIAGARNYVIKNHFKNYHDTQGKNPESIFSCKACSAPFLKESQLKDHYSHCEGFKEPDGYEDRPLSRAPSTVSSIGTMSISLDTAIATADRLAE